MKATTEAARLGQAICRLAANACSIRATPSSNALADRRCVYAGRFLEQ